jgi:hypothetical protein
MDLKLIIGVVIVVIILYIIWSYFFTSMQVLMSFQDAAVLKSVALTSIDSSKSNYSFSAWTYINDWGTNYGKRKNILVIPDGPSSFYYFALYFSETTNDLQIYVGTQSSTSTSNSYLAASSTDKGYFTTTCNVTNFPLQTWVNISVSVYNRAIDVYIDGKLIKTCSMSDVARPIPTGKSIYIGGEITSSSNLPGFSGYIASVLYNSDVFSPKEAWDIYARGYNNSAFDLNVLKRYKLQMSFLKDNSVLKQFSI